MKPYPYQLFVKGIANGDIDIEELERKLTVLFGEKLGKLDKLEIGSENEDFTSYSLATVWGYIENFILDDGQEVSLKVLERYVGVQRNTAISILKKLCKYQVVYRTGRYNTFRKSAKPGITLARQLELNPLRVGLWEPKVQTFPGLEGRPMDQLVIDPSKFTKASKIRNYIFSQLQVGDILHTNAVVAIGGCTSAQARDVMARMVKNGYLESIGDTTALRWKIKAQGDADADFMVWTQQRQGQAWLDRVKVALKLSNTRGEIGSIK